MIQRSQNGLVIAIAYYDGEEEGFSCIDGDYAYFKRLYEGEIDNSYVSVPIEECEFSKLSSAAHADSMGSGVFIYAGDSDCANTLIASLVNKYGRLLETHGVSSHGENFLQACKKPSIRAGSLPDG